MGREKFYQQNNKPEDIESRTEEQADIPPEKPAWEIAKELFHKKRKEEHLTGEDKYNRKKHH